MPVNVRIRVDAKRAIKQMREMERRSKDFRPVFRWAKKELEKANKANFTANGLPVGGWSPLDARYGAWKAREFPGQPIMQATGRLFRSLASLDGSPNRIGRTSAEFGTEIEYAKFHQYGTSKMAKRQIVYEPRGFARTLGRIVGQHIVDGEFR